MELPCDSAVPTLGIPHREVKMYSHTETHAQVFIAAIFGIVKNRKIPKSSMSDWMNRLVCPSSGTQLSNEKERPIDTLNNLDEFQTRFTD